MKKHEEEVRSRQTSMNDRFESGEPLQYNPLNKMATSNNLNQGAQNFERMSTIPDVHALA